MVFVKSYNRGLKSNSNIDLINKTILTENEVNLIKRRLNDGKIKIEDLKEEYDLTSDQIQKGKSYLMNQWKSPTGKVRANNPFGYRETNILEDFKTINLYGFHNIGNYTPFYVPIYSVRSSNNGFEYYVDYKGVNIYG